MSSAGTRQRDLPLMGPVAVVAPKTTYGFASTSDGVLANGKQITVSESHRRNRSTGNYEEGGPFFTSRVTHFINPGKVKEAFKWSQDFFYSGPIYGPSPTLNEQKALGFTNTALSFGDKNESQMKADGTTAISLVGPTNPASNLGTTLAETFREGVPSLPGIQSWKRRTEALKAAGSEYLNYQFGWAPLAHEVNEVTKAAKFHGDIMKQYHKGEGSNTHRRFDFPLQRSVSSIPATTAFPSFPAGSGWWDLSSPAPERKVSLVKETKKWFEGCFTYGLPSSADSWKKHLGYGSDASQLFGLSLTPSLLWELTPWSWAVDWFSNAGDVINNVTNFGLAGLVLRYGYVMEESIERVTVEGGGARMPSTSLTKPRSTETTVLSSSWSRGFEIVTKRRTPASPFGFSVGWEGLSPTQLAITAALGITKLL